MQCQYAFLFAALAKYRVHFSDARAVLIGKLQVILVLMASEKPGFVAYRLGALALLVLDLFREVDTFYRYGLVFHMTVKATFRAGQAVALEDVVDTLAAGQPSADGPDERPDFFFCQVNPFPGFFAAQNRLFLREFRRILPAGKRAFRVAVARVAHERRFLDSQARALLIRAAYFPTIARVAILAALRHKATATKPLDLTGFQVGAVSPVRAFPARRAVASPITEYLSPHAGNFYAHARSDPRKGLPVI